MFELRASGDSSDTNKTNNKNNLQQQPGFATEIKSLTLWAGLFKAGLR